MKKWNRALALLLAAGLTAGLYGCGGPSASISSQPPILASQAVLDVPTPEPTPTPTPEPTPEPTPTSEPELHGLIYTEGYAFNGVSTTTVYCLNPETGAAEIISNFGNFKDPSDGYYTYGRGVSEDFKKICCTKTFSNSGENHAGWIDTEGNFFDVTEALGLQAKSDFDAPVDYRAVGFYNGLYGFEDLGRESSLYDTYYYYVPLDNISPEAIQEGDIKKAGRPDCGDILINTVGVGKTITDWIDDTHCIVDFKEAYFSTTYDSYIVDVATQTKTEYIPGDSRDNWSGIISPDRTRIAFLSAPRQAAFSRVTDIYITSVNGGDPVKVNCSLDPEKSYTLIAWI